MIDRYKFGVTKWLANNIRRWKSSEKTCKAYFKTNGNYKFYLTSAIII